MRLFYEMFISLDVIVRTLSGERGTVAYAMTTYAAGFYTVSASGRKCLWLSPCKDDTVCSRNTEGIEQTVFTIQLID